MGWITPEGPGPIDLSRCVSCGLCLAVCPTYQLTTDESASPRGRLSAMAAVADDALPMDETFEDVMGFCLQCRACEAICPALVPFGRMMEGVRAELEVQRPSVAKRVRDAALGRWVSMPGLISAGVRAARTVQRVGVTMPGMLDGLRRGQRVNLRGREFPAIGPERGVVGLLLGCIMESGFSDVHVATIGVLRRAGYRVTTSGSQTCCGALAAHEGAALEAHRLAERNAEAFADVDVVVADAAGCSAHLKEYDRWAEGSDVASKARDVVEVVADAIEAEHLPVLAVPRGPVTVQDPCHLRHAQRVVEQPRIILRAAGYEIVELDDQGLCCGAAGAWGMLNPAASDELGDRKRALIRAAGSTIVASANVGCEMQLRAHLDEWYDVAHPVELYWRALTEHGQ
jgi:glycolate oxidase iron-sulfur subunit